MTIGEKLRVLAIISESQASLIEVLPPKFNDKEPKLSWRMNSTKARLTIACEVCKKFRVVFSQAIVKKDDRELLLNGIDKIDFMCGGHTGKLFPAGFALVPPDHSSYDTQVTFFGCYRVSMKYSCDDPIEKT